MGENDLLLQLINIGKSFSGVRVLQNINLTLRKGQILGLVGENGAGKSTLMNVLGGIHKPDEGSIFIEGQETKHKSPLDALDKGIAFVHQELNLFKRQIIASNITLPNPASSARTTVSTFLAWSSCRQTGTLAFSAWFFIT